MKTLKRIAACLLAGSLALSCVFPYEGDLDSIEGTLVIEGDIILGKSSTVRVSRVLSLDAPSSGSYIAVSSNVWVEGEDGTVYPGVRSMTDVPGYSVDLRDAAENTRYRLHVSITESGRNYVSSWREPQMAPVIDDISFEVEKTDNPRIFRPQGKARVSMHARPGASRFFRWDYEQEWQYHAWYMQRFDYDFTEMDYVPYYDESIYWCWAKSPSLEAQIAIAIGDEQNQIRDHAFLEFNTATGDLFQKRYALHMVARGVSEECYQYLYTLQMNSNSTGDLFAPNPSELRGNIVCEEDPDELVLGFIEVSRTEEAWAFVNDPDAYYDPGDRTNPPLVDLPPAEIESYYLEGWRPVKEVAPDEGPTYYGWAPAAWCDCRSLGGTNVKPSYWED